MNLISRLYKKLIDKNKGRSVQETLYNLLEDLERLEAKIHGIVLNTIRDNEEKVVEDSNHLLVILRKDNKDNVLLKKVLKKKDLREFLEDLSKIREDFLILKKEITKKDRLKLLISEFSLKCIDPNNYLELERVFVLEKQLFQVLERQDEELEIFFKELNKMRIKKNKQDDVKYFIDSVKKIREILAGHLEHHKYWEEERSDYTNISNIIHSLKKEVRKYIK